MLKISRNWFNRSRLNHLSWLGVAAVVSCFGFILTISFMLFPTLPQKTSAVEWKPGAEQKPPLDVSGTSVSINLPATIVFDAVTPTASGATTTANANLTIATTNSASYSLYLYSSDGDSSLRSINPANTSTVDAINNGGVGLTLSSLEPNTWGYSLGTSAPTDTTTYSAVPTSNADPIKTKDTSATASANDTYVLSFGTKVDTSIPSGTYSGTLTVAVVAEPALVTIAFDGNGATGGSMSNQQIVAGQTANLNTNQYTRDGYDFTGWNTNAGGTGTSYADGESYTAPAGSAGQTVTLYAQWKASIPPAPTGYMQDFTFQQCQYYASVNNYTLIDRRDNNAYTVRYINGVCWMTQNLRLAGGTTLTSTYSNVSSSYTLPTDSTSGFNSYTVANMHYSGNTTTGAWYNYCAASAGTVCSQTQQDASYDICPKGWRLPTYNEISGISGTSYISAFSPVTGGYYSSGSLYNTGIAYWWSSTAYDSRQYRLYYNGSALGTNYGYKYSGNYVRCIRSS